MRGVSLSAFGLFRSNRPYTVYLGRRSLRHDAERRASRRAQHRARATSYRTVDLSLAKRFRAANKNFEGAHRSVQRSQHRQLRRVRRRVVVAVFRAADVGVSAAADSARGDWSGSDAMVGAGQRSPSVRRDGWTIAVAACSVLSRSSAVRAVQQIADRHRRPAPQPTGSRADVADADAAAAPGPESSSAPATSRSANGGTHGRDRAAARHDRRRCLHARRQRVPERIARELPGASIARGAASSGRTHPRRAITNT